MVHQRERAVRCAQTISFVVILLLFAASSRTQTPPPAPKTFTLDQTVEYALAHYPAVRAALSQIDAAHAGVDVAKTAYLPQVNLLWQSNRATRNNIFGQLLPQSVIPSISGPVLLTADEGSAWGSAAGALVSWEPFDFGYRRATVDVARAGQNVAAAQAGITRLDVAVAAANAYFALLASEQVTQAAQANLKRREVFEQSVDVLVQNQLRPGADASRAHADFAQARIRLIQAQTAENSSRAVLAALLGVAPADLEIAPGNVLAAIPQASLPQLAPANNPFVGAQKADMDQVRARQDVLAKSYYPKFSVLGSISGRGTGAEVSGLLDGGASGLWLQRSNWALGAQVTFPVLQIFSLHAQKRVEAANEITAQARYDQTVQDLSGRVAQARANLDGARQIALSTPIELAAAHDTEQQVRARYQEGLATIIEVSDAESLLVQAEIDDAIARLDIWRTLAEVAAAQGDMHPFLELLRAEKH